MDCSTCRDCLSARLDGEATEHELQQLTAHLDGCRTCRRHERRLLAFTRATRLRPAEPVPDLSAAILARVPVRDGTALRRPGRAVAQYALVVVALTQLVLALPELLPVASASAPVHLEHHLGAWDVAMAIGLLVAAWQPERARGLLPMALALGGTLLVMSIADVLGGNTLALNEAPHILELAGVSLLWLLSHAAGPQRRHRPA